MIKENGSAIVAARQALQELQRERRINEDLEHSRNFLLGQIDELNAKVERQASLIESLKGENV